MIDEVKQSVRDSLDVIRSISRGLSPDFVNQQGLLSSLQQLVERASHRTNRTIQLHAEPGFAIREPSHAIIVFRIVRECLTNAIRHGNASLITVELKEVENSAHVAIRDNGAGMQSVSDHGNGQGFRTMQHYAGLMNGELGFAKQEGGGTEILLTFPNNHILN
jgi:two-component system, NarL family, sensor histidine kinase DegS